jgi:hypothetical protein
MFQSSVVDVTGLKTLYNLMFNARGLKVQKLTDMRFFVFISAAGKISARISSDLSKIWPNFFEEDYSSFLPVSKFLS